MKLFDSHCHLDDRSYRKDLPSVVHRAEQEGVLKMMTVGIDRQTSQQAIAIANRFEGVFASVGVHPHRAAACSEDVLVTLSGLAKDPRVRAWGETGLDFNRMYSPQADQEKWFLRQLETAGELGLPVILHERDSQGKLIALLKSQPHPDRRGVVHCFSGNRSELRTYLDMGLFIGITGIVTIKKRGAELRELIRYVPVDRSLIETDAPYLTPTPQKNKTRRNEPAFVKSVLLKLSDIYGKDPEQIALQTWKNACRLFNIPPDG